jgi:hypothetical protein
MSKYAVKGLMYYKLKEENYMNNLATRLITDDDFEYAMKNQSPVTVWQEKKLLGYGDRINKFDAFSVVIDGDHYVRSVCAFRLT